MSVGRAAFALGMAGLLPPAGGVLLQLAGERDGALLVLSYALVILSFLGGMWWGLAMQRPPERQGAVLVAAVMPSLVALAIAVTGAWLGQMDLALLATGICVLLTLPVDRELTQCGDAPANWMRLRVPLSVGLGVLAIVSGMLAST